MPRKMKRTHEELRQAAIETAHALVADEGMSALTIRRVADAIDCSIGTIYNLFIDLDDLELHLSVRVLAEMGAAMFGSRLPDDPVERLRTIAARYIAFAFAQPNLWSMLFNYRMSSERPLPDWHVAAVATLVGEAHRHGQAAFPGDEADARASIEVLWASVHGIASLGLSGKLGFVTEASAQSLADRLVVTYVAGLGGRTG